MSEMPTMRMRGNPRPASAFSATAGVCFLEWTFPSVSGTRAALGRAPALTQAPCRNPILNLKRGRHVQVLVRDNNVDQALKALKKKMQREGIFREMKLRGHYEKPSEKRAREKAEAIRRARKLARKRA